MLRGLTAAEAELPAGSYFDAFPWVPLDLDPEMTAGDFLDAL